MAAVRYRRAGTHGLGALFKIANDGELDAIEINSPCGLGIARDLGVSVICTLHSARKATESRIFAAHPEAFYVAISARQLKLKVIFGEPPSSTMASTWPSTRHPPRTMAMCFTSGVSLERRGHEPSTRRGSPGFPSCSRGAFTTNTTTRISIASSVLGFSFRGSPSTEGRFEEKVRLLRGAKALLCPIDWEEPFGLVAIEAMLTGTPVLGFPRGAFPEIVDEGVTGNLVRDVAEMAQAIRRLDGWDRLGCSQHAASRFSSTRMTEDYERLMLSLAEDTPRLKRASGVFPVPKKSAPRASVRLAELARPHGIQGPVAG